MAKQKTVDKETNDKTVDKDGLTVLRCIRESKREATEAKRRRMNLNKQNLMAYMGQQDWSHKQAGQSREFLPKTPVAVEQFSAFIKKSLVGFGDWFSVKVPSNSPLNDHQVRELMKCFLEYLADGMRDSTTFALRVSDGCKLSLLEALMIFKVHGYQVPQSVYSAERGIKFIEGSPEITTKLKTKYMKPWRLAIDLIRPDDYFPDPTGRNLYKIHRTERDFHDVVELAAQGLYDENVVDRIAADFDDRTKEYAEALTRNQQGVAAPSFRKTVVIDEYWGDIVDTNGDLVESNVLCAMANEKYLIRAVEKNPYWHGRCPIVPIPLIRVPDTVWHKAIFDHAAPLNMALNEIGNLILDGGLASVWGIKQLRMGGLEDPRQVSGGVPQGITLAVKDEFPVGEKILETVSTGDVPQDALATYNLFEREFLSATLGNELSAGFLPTKEVRSTEVVEMAQSKAVTLDGIAVDMETNLVEVLELAWLTMMQNADMMERSEVVAAIGPKAALMLSRMSPAERFAAFGNGYGFKVFGLSATMARVRDFQKFMAALQSISQMPFLLEPFLQEFSPKKTLDWLWKSLVINPENFKMDPDEMQDLPNRINRMAALAQSGMIGGGASKNVPGAASGPNSSVPQEVQQLSNPMTGLTPGGM